MQGLVFFRFPGLVSSSPLMQAVAAHHLISLGADAWLALGQTARDGSIILVHPNGNEPRGLQIYRRDVVNEQAGQTSPHCAGCIACLAWPRIWRP